MCAKRVLRSGANYDSAKVSRETSFDCSSGGPSKTIQSAKDESDINVIVRRFGVTRMMPTAVRVPSYGDYETVGDFHTAMNVVRQAEENFLLMPATVRARFGNDPGRFLDFASRSENIDELRKMGLAIPKKDDNIPIPSNSTVKGKEKANEHSEGRAVKSGKASGRTAEGSDGVKGGDGSGVGE